MSNHVRRSRRGICVLALLLILSRGGAQEATSTPEPDLAARTAELYERSHTALLAAFGLDETYQNSYLPTELGVPCYAWQFSEEVWGDAVARSAQARELFAQAAVLPAPRFEEILAKGPALLHEGGDVCQRLGEVVQVVAAHGYVVREAQPRLALNDGYTLLRFSRHLVGHGRGDGIWIGRDAETLGMRLIRDVLADVSERESASVLSRCREELERHRRDRDDLARVGGYLAAELPKTVLGPPPLAEGEEDESPEVAEARVQKERAIALLTGLIEPLTHNPPPTVDEYRRHLEPFETRLKKLNLITSRHSSFEALDGDLYYLVDSAMPPLKAHLEEEHLYLGWLAEAEARLAELLRDR